jgi:hypothetical protein
LSIITFERVQVCRLLEALDVSESFIHELRQIASLQGIDVVFSVMNGFLDQKLMSSYPIPLTAHRLALRRAGIYALFQFERLVYIGSAAKVKSRVRDHWSSVDMATKLNVDEFYYKYTTCSLMAALSAEKELIPFYQPPWNGIGFGSKANGNGRRGHKKSVWDEMYGREVTR